MANVFKTLQDTGTLGFARYMDAGKAIKSADLGGGYFATATVDDLEDGFSFVWAGVHRDALDGVLIDDIGAQVARVKYVWDFVRARLQAGNEPFIIEDIAEGVSERTRHLVQITSLKFDQKQGNKPWLYGFSLTCRAVHLPNEDQVEQVGDNADIVG